MLKIIHSPSAPKETLQSPSSAISKTQPSDGQRMKRRRGRQPRPSMLSSAIKSSIRIFASHVGQPRVIEPAGFRDFRGWLAFINSQIVLPLWSPIIEAVRSETNGDPYTIDKLKADVVREIVKIVVVPRVGESSKLVSTNCGRQCARPSNGVTLMIILDRLLSNPSDCSVDYQRHSSTSHLLIHGQQSIDHHKFMLHHHHYLQQQRYLEQQQQQHLQLRQQQQRQQSKTEQESNYFNGQTADESKHQRTTSYSERALTTMSDGILYNTSLRDANHRKPLDNVSSISIRSTTTAGSPHSKSDHVRSSSLDSLLNNYTETSLNVLSSQGSDPAQHFDLSPMKSGSTNSLPSFKELENSLTVTVINKPLAVLPCLTARVSDHKQAAAYSSSPSNGSSNSRNFTATHLK